MLRKIFVTSLILLQNVVKEAVNIYTNIHSNWPESMYGAVFSPTTFDCSKTLGFLCLNESFNLLRSTSTKH